ncbi:hypothetical protein [Methylobacterium symbioticum]|uniref:Uncharacterized protein n=1 Tax=Methylobacterium symbioticum TaxID=2584084 RepID=A0A509E8U6_9HYPH|nr:hypothetical protein [Methylobacterium symbioticum]VUD70025.1 hypothetical protein MET9862_00586 [Methylobacterium symbioticum]
MPRNASRHATALSDWLAATDESALYADLDRPTGDLVTGYAETVTRFTPHGIDSEGGDGSFSVKTTPGGVVIEAWVFPDGTSGPIRVRSAPIPASLFRTMIVRPDIDLPDDIPF